MIWLGAYFIAVCVTAALTPLLIRFARHSGLMDLPDARKVHVHPTPRLGGVAIVIAVLAASLPLLPLVGPEHGWPHLFPRLWAVLACAVAVAVIGLVDDLVGLAAELKLVGLLVVAVSLCAAGVRIHSINLGDWFSVQLGGFGWPLTILWILAVTIGMNFIDGLDGLAAGIALVTCAIVAVVASYGGQMALALVNVALLGSLSAFLYFNYNPAKIFLGDCGSMLLGFLLAACSVLCTERVRTIGLALPALALGIPILDMICTFIRRGVLDRRSLFAAECGHVHHRLLGVGLQQRHAVFLLHGVTCICGAVGLVMLFTHRTGVIVGLTAAVFCLLLGLFRISGSINVGQLAGAVQHIVAMGRSANGYRRRFEDLQLRFRREQTFQGWWEQLCAAAEALDFTYLFLSLLNRDGTDRVLTWRQGDAHGAPGKCIGATIPIRHRRIGDPLWAEVRVDTKGCLEDAGRRITLFARLVEENSLADLAPSTAHVPKSFVHPTRRSAGAKRPAVAAATPRLCGPSAFAQGLRIAVVHDFLYTYGGAERVLEQILRVFPQADLFSLFDFVPPAERGFLCGKAAHTSFLQRLPMTRTRHRAYLPLMPLAIEQLDVSGYDIVISSSYVAAKGVITRPDQLHISYCHSPARFAWDLQHQYLAEAGLHSGLRSLAVRGLLHYIRNWDVRCANGVDVFVTNSRFVSRRVQKAYGRSSTPIYPPVDVEQFTLEPEKYDYYLTASRMVPYKRMDLIVEAFGRLGHRRLIVVGDGPEFAKISTKAGPNVKLVGHVSQEQLKGYLQRARAFVFAAEEDFGIVPVEAQACGTPVIAFGRGGATESVVEGRTGLFFPEQAPDSLSEAVRQFESRTWDAYEIRRHAEQFSTVRFRNELLDLVRREWSAFAANSAPFTPRTELSHGGFHAAAETWGHREEPAHPPFGAVVSAEAP